MSTTPEKAIDVADIEKTGGSSIDVDSAAPQFPTVPTLSGMEYRKLIWKMDIHLLPPLFALWFVSLIDRLNIGSAKIFGIEKDLNMNPKGNDFNIALIIVMIPLIVFEIPSNWLLKKLSPSKVLAAESVLLCKSLIRSGAKNI